MWLKKWKENVECLCHQLYEHSTCLRIRGLHRWQSPQYDVHWTDLPSQQVAVLSALQVSSSSPSLPSQASFKQQSRTFSSRQCVHWSPSQSWHPDMSQNDTCSSPLSVQRPFSHL